MVRLLAIALLAVLIWMLLDWMLRRGLTALGLDPKTGRRPGVRGPRAAGSDRAEVLVACSACGTYVPVSRALPMGRDGKRVVCSEACRSRLEAAADG